MWIIYRADNTISASTYIGITSTTLGIRRSGHFCEAFTRNAQHPFARAIRKHGKEAFVWSEIARVDTEAEALDMERFFIATLKPRYNATSGGDIRHLSRSQRIAAHRGRTPASYLQRKGVTISLPRRKQPSEVPPPIYVEGFIPKWRAVPGYEGAYEISDHGDVRSCDRQVKCWPNGGTMLRGGKPMSPRPMSDGRLFITLYKYGKARTVALSVLVAMAFLGLPQSGQRALRRDRDLRNDHASNIYWGDARELAANRKRTGGERCGENHPNAKITDEQVRFIKSMRGVITQKEIAQRFGIDRATVSMIQLGRSRETVRML